MRMVYAGKSSSAQAEAYASLLSEIGDVSVIDVDELASADLSGAHVLVVDASHTHAVPSGLTLKKLVPPTVLIGNFGVKIGDALDLKFGSHYGCMCLDSDAIVWDTTHPVFSGLAPHLVEKPVPENFLHHKSYLTVPDRVATLRVLQDVGEEPGQVTTGLGFLDSPDCEVIAGGFNEKSHEHFAVARQGRFLHWGFSGAPNKLTTAGRALFIACLRYITLFADDPVREFRTTPSRQILQSQLAYEGWRGIGLPPEMSGMMITSFLKGIFARGIPVALFGDKAKRLAWYDEHAPYLRNEGAGWFVDEDARSLGLPNNDLAMLDACLKAGDERAARLWQRYTGRSLDDVRAERAWLDVHRAHLYFTDWGGYRWVSELNEPSPKPPLAHAARPAAAASMGAARYGGHIKVALQIQIPAGYHAYAPGSDQGLALAVLPADGFELVGELELEPSDGYPVGQVFGRCSVRGSGDELVLKLRVQLCDILTCLPPQTLDLRCPITPAS